jgi:hypothetical protein
VIRTRDRRVAIALLLLAVTMWGSLAALASLVYPDQLEVRLAAAGLVGSAVGTSVAPLAWLAAFARRGRITRPGDWPRALRRGSLAGALSALLATLALTGSWSVPIVVFAVVLVVAVELSASYRR